MPSPGSDNTLFYTSSRYVSEGITKSYGPVFRMVTNLNYINNTYVMSDAVRINNII